MTSAIWKLIDRLWLTRFTPIFTGLSRSLDGQRQRAQEACEAVGQRMQLEPHGVRLEAMAG
jgi:hypothetical protein